MARTPNPRHIDARNTLSRCISVGVVLAIIGGVIMAASWPGTETVYSAGRLDEQATGSGEGVAFGLLIAAVGNCFLWVGFTGLAVRLGVEAVHPSSSALSS